uniref:Mitochondrial import inner membrane translocase subunit Tim21 n=1 Tax=Blastobotrys adeninivorans TaxID=409370 RepID=A0A060T7W4_BLAAD
MWRSRLIRPGRIGPITNALHWDIRGVAFRSQLYSTKADSSRAADTKIPWSIRIKHATSFSFYSAIVLAGVGMSGLVIYYFISDILLPTSDVQVFNRAFHLVKEDEECLRRLGGNKLSAYGEQSGNKWARNRPIASRRGFDGAGREHLLMQFHVKGDLAEGLVRLEMVKSDKKGHGGIGQFDFRYLALEVPGYNRYYLIDNSPKLPKRQWTNNTGFLGVKWGKPKDGDASH